MFSQIHSYFKSP